MVSNNTPLAGLVGIILVVALIAVVAGLAASGTDLLNSNTSAAAARERDLATQYKSQINAIDAEAYRAQKEAEIEKTALDLENHKTVQAAETQAQLDKIRLQVEAHQRKLDQDLVLARLTTYALVVSGMLTLLALGTGAAIFLGRLGRSRLVLAQAQVTTANAWRIRQASQARKNGSVGPQTGQAVKTGQEKFAFGDNGDHSREKQYVSTLQ